MLGSTLKIKSIAISSDEFLEIPETQLLGQTEYVSPERRDRIQSPKSYLK
jgi:hypothetical protein